MQARTNVNKGILQTIETSPEMFFAYNNGLTATAEKVEVEKNKEGHFEIKSLQDFQIVNGGQTTASILYAKDNQGAELENVTLQMKLSEVSSKERIRFLSHIVIFLDSRLHRRGLMRI